MTEGIKSLRRLQGGRETTAGTALAATFAWRGEGVLQDDSAVMFPVEDVGLIGRTNRTYKPNKAASLAMDSTPATFEQLPHIFEAGIKTATPAADGSGSGYIRTYQFPSTATNTLKTYTWEGGDNIQAEEMEYSFVESIELNGAPNEAWMMSANWQGRQITKTTFTAAASAPVPAVEEILFNTTKVYIDAVDGTAGTTQVSNTVLSCDVSITTGWQRVFSADGNLFFSFIKGTGHEITGSITYEHNTSGVTEKDAQVAETARLLQIRAEGSAFTTAGTGYSKKTMILNLPIKYESVEMGEQDGNDILICSFRALYDSNYGESNIIVVNDVAAL